MDTVRPQLCGTFGMVSAPDWFAAAAGMAMLEAGGNAFDAVVAAGFVLQIVEPHMCGPAGEVPILFATAGDGGPRVLCGQGPAPRAATPTYFSNLGIKVIPGSGLLPAAVPGAFDAWMLLLRDYGTRSLREVLTPAIGYAEKGHPLLSYTSQRIRQLESTFREHWPTSAALYLRTGETVNPLTIHRNPALAATYRRIIAEGEAAGRDRMDQIDAARRSWYQGFVADRIEEFARTPQPDETGDRHAGLLTADDLARYQASYEDPVSLDWNGWTVLKPGHWSQGPTMLQQLTLLEDVPPAATPDVEHIHRVVESAKLAYADREAYYGDIPDVPLKTLLSRDYAADRRRLIGQEASRRLRPGHPDGRSPRLPRVVLESVAGRGGEADGSSRWPQARGDTCHVDAVDRFGNIVGATPSGGYLMASPVIESLGFPLGNRLEMAWLEEGLPNTLRPGRRPRTTLSPTLVQRDGEALLTFGSPGADLQDQWGLTFFLDITAGLSLQEAVERPRWHTNHLVASNYPHKITLGHLAIEADESLGDDVIAGLRERGHDVVQRPRVLGRICAVGRDPETNLLYAAADPRGDTYACGR